MKVNKNNKTLLGIIVSFVVSLAVATGLIVPGALRGQPFDLEDVPAFSGEPYVIVCDNVPDFSRKDLTTRAYEYYSELDALGRCGYAMACIGMELMPTEERGSIGQVKPSGWQLEKYDFVDGKYLYNRCHLIGFQLSGENANEQNLITGTRYLNVQGMLPFENRVAEYVRDTGNHVIYRVTPIFVGDELVARGVQMEAMSVEDGGVGISFNIYAYNCHPGVVIDYATGKSALAPTADGEEEAFVLNTNSERFHLPDCDSVSSMSPSNKEYYKGSRQALLEMGYKPCGSCNP